MLSRELNIELLRTDEWQRYWRGAFTPLVLWSQWTVWRSLYGVVSACCLSLLPTFFAMPPSPPPSCPSHLCIGGIESMLQFTIRPVALIVCECVCTKLLLIFTFSTWRLAIRTYIKRLCRHSESWMMYIHTQQTRHSLSVDIKQLRSQTCRIDIFMLVFSAPGRRFEVRWERGEKERGGKMWRFEAPDANWVKTLCRFIQSYREKYSQIWMLNFSYDCGLDGISL